MIQKPTPKIREPKPLRSRAHLLPIMLRADVLKRDEFTCRWCKVPGGHLDVHHILPRGRGGKDHLDNLAALHRSCHEQVHLHPLQGKKAGLLL